MDADVLMILTEVERVSLNFNTPEQRDLSALNLADAARYCEEGHFQRGVCCPRFRPAMKFVKSKSVKACRYNVA